MSQHLLLHCLVPTGFLMFTTTSWAEQETATAIVAYAMAYGGFAQMVAGVLEVSGYADSALQRGSWQQWASLRSSYLCMAAQSQRLENQLIPVLISHLHSLLCSARVLLFPSSPCS